MKQHIKSTIQTDEKIRNKQHVNIGQILKQPINRMPISAQFINTKKVNVKPFIKPLKDRINTTKKTENMLKHGYVTHQ